MSSYNRIFFQYHDSSTTKISPSKSRIRNSNINSGNIDLTSSPLVQYYILSQLQCFVNYIMSFNNLFLYCFFFNKISVDDCRIVPYLIVSGTMTYS